MKKSTGETIDVSLSYKIVSNGSVIVETSVEDGTEMISTYKDRFGKLTGTHYCALGNQPMFNLSESTDSVLDFELDPACGLKEGKHKFVKALKYTNASKSKNLKGILTTNNLPLVSKDFNHNPASSIFDLTQTQVINENFCRVLSWYDNEWGFSNRMMDVAILMGK